MSTYAHRVLSVGIPALLRSPAVSQTAAKRARPGGGQLTKVVITTDGGCKPNPGNGAWSAILRCGDRYREISGRANDTTNNRMEMTAFLEALRCLIEPCHITLRTDSKILIYSVLWNGENLHKRKNQDLILDMHEEMRRGRHIVNTLWVEGHAGDYDNERCDLLCNQILGTHK